jgi:hypothetical protein
VDDDVIPPDLVGLIYAALGTVAGALDKEGHPMARTLATVISIFEEGVQLQVGGTALGDIAISGIRQFDSITDGEDLLGKH